MVVLMRRVKGVWYCYEHALQAEGLPAVAKHFHANARAISSQHLDEGRTAYYGRRLCHRSRLRITTPTFNSTHLEPIHALSSHENEISS